MENRREGFDTESDNWLRQVLVVVTGTRIQNRDRVVGSAVVKERQDIWWHSGQ